MPLSDLESSGDEQEHLSAEGHEDHDEEDDIHTHLTRAASSVKTATTTAAGTGTATTAATTAAAARLLSSSNSSSAAARLMVPASATGRGAGGDNKLRACMLCGLVKSVPLFRVNGCENCDTLLKLKGSLKRIGECTSANFDGVVAIMQPTRSWVAKWQRSDKFTKGLYALRVSGLLPEDVVDDLSDQGIQYRPRDGSVLD